MTSISELSVRHRSLESFGLYVALAFGGAWGIELLLVAAGVRLDGPTAAIWLILVSLIPGAAAILD